MLVIFLLASIFGGDSLKIFVPSQLESPPELPCVVNVTRHYFSKTKSIVYVKQDKEVDLLLNNLHSKDVITFRSKMKANKIKPTIGYFFVVVSVQTFEELLSHMKGEDNWNPYARFLIVYKSLTTEHLSDLFDILLNYRVYNVVILNGTSSTELYTYNPFENFACGRYFTRIISFGKCPEITTNIYPRKHITGLRNCFFNVTVGHWPPWGINPALMNPRLDVIGVEQYIFSLMAEIEQFKFKFDLNVEAEDFPRVTGNKSTTGAMMLLSQNRIDVVLGGRMLIPERANNFGYVSGHVDYLDEIRFIVKRANLKPAWKNIYLEFTTEVWALLIMSLLVYAALVATLLKTSDLVKITLMLMKNLIIQGYSMRYRESVKLVIIIWVFSAYLLNSYYTTTLMSLTTSPSLDYQIQNEETVMRYRLKPCISLVMGQYLESQHNHGEILKDVQVGTEGCEKIMESIKTVSKSNELFTIVLYSVYYNYRFSLYDEYGTTAVRSFAKPYAKVIYAMYFNKGSPMQEKLHLLALRIREVGLSDKVLDDVYFNQSIVYRFRTPYSVARFAIPWYLYIVGVSLSTIIFCAEQASQYRKAQRIPVN